MTMYRASQTAIIDCPVCQQTLHVDYWPPERDTYERPGDSADFDGDMCPCYDSRLVDQDEYRNEILRRCHEARD